MRDKSFMNLQYLIPRGQGSVGAWSRILILGGAGLGAPRFDRFQKSRGAAHVFATGHKMQPAGGANV